MAIWLRVGIKPPLTRHHFWSFQSSEIQKCFGEKKNTNQCCHDSTWLDSTHGSYKHKPTAASPCCTHTQRTHSSPKWAPRRGLQGRHTHTSSRRIFFFFFSAIMAALKAGENTIFVLSTGRSDKPDSVLTWWSGELMSPSTARTRTFFTPSGKDLFLGFVLRLQPRLWTAGLPQLWEGFFLACFHFQPSSLSGYNWARILHNLSAHVNTNP